MPAFARGIDFAAFGQEPVGQLELTRAVADSVPVPVIASGGAGRAEHLRDAFTSGHASAALVAGILHDGLTTVGALKSALTTWGIDVRPTPAPAGKP